MKVVNRVTNETWNCDNLNDVVLIEGIEYVKVYNYAKEYPNLMKKSILTPVLTNEQQYDDRNQLNG